MSIIHGLLERISYHNEENDFVVAKLREKEKKGLTTIVGNLSGVNPGESLKLTGKWVQNKRFGEQFQVETFEVTVPATLHGIQKYLASGLIKGIGPIMSERIVEKFGLHTLEVIEKTPEKLSEVEGIGPKRISMIRKAWEEQKEIKEIMIFLQGHGVSAAYSAKIYKQYGDQSIEIVRENPYRLAHDIYGIGFITADKIAQNLGIDRNSLIRAKAGLIYVLNQLTEEGHVYYPESQLIHKAKEILNVDEEIIILAVKELSKEKELFLEDLDPDGNLRAALSCPLPCGRNGSGSEVDESEGISFKHPAHPSGKGDRMGAAEIEHRTCPKTGGGGSSGSHFKGVDYHRWPWDREDDPHHGHTKNLSAIKAEDPSRSSHRKGSQENE